MTASGASGSLAVAPLAIFCAAGASPFSLAKVTVTASCTTYAPFSRTVTKLSSTKLMAPSAAESSPSAGSTCENVPPVIVISDSATFAWLTAMPVHSLL